MGPQLRKGPQVLGERCCQAVSPTPTWSDWQISICLSERSQRALDQVLEHQEVDVVTLQETGAGEQQGPREMGGGEGQRAT